jgi:hypothetical protein
MHPSNSLKEEFFVQDTACQGLDVYIPIHTVSLVVLQQTAYWTAIAQQSLNQMPSDEAARACDQDHVASRRRIISSPMAVTTPLVGGLIQQI